MTQSIATVAFARATVLRTTYGTLSSTYGAVPFRCAETEVCCVLSTVVVANVANQSLFPVYWLDVLR